MRRYQQQQEREPEEQHQQNIKAGIIVTMAGLISSASIIVQKGLPCAALSVVCGHSSTAPQQTARTRLKLKVVEWPEFWNE